MRKLFTALFVSILMVFTSLPVIASQDRGRIPDNLEMIHSGLEYTMVYRYGELYLSGQMIIETGYVGSDEVISREYITVYISMADYEAELSAPQYVCIMPFDSMPRTRWWLIGGSTTRIANIAVRTSVAHTSRFTFYNDTYTTISSVNVFIETNTLGNTLANRILPAGLWFNISVPFATMSYNVYVGNPNSGGGTASFSIHRL